MFRTAIARTHLIARANARNYTKIAPRVIPHAADDATIAKYFGTGPTLSRLFDRRSDFDAFTQLLSDDDVIDVTLDAGRCVTIHSRTNDPELVLPSKTLSASDIETIWASLTHTAHDRAIAPGSLNRWSALRDHAGSVVGLTMRKHSTFDVHDVLTDEMKTTLPLGKSTLLFGPPGSGKTTALRAISEYMSTYARRRVIVVDESGELGGGGSLPVGIGSARRICVHPGTSHADAIDHAVRNHTPAVVIIDELLTEADAAAAMRAASRGVQLIATTHARSVADIVSNPAMVDLTGGRQHAAVSDDTAAQTGSKFASARTTNSVFGMAIDVAGKRVIHNLDKVVDQYL